MCTVTLRRDPTGLLLTMNRDELRTRGPEIPPIVSDNGGATVPWLGPRDTARGGTWIGVNAHGVTACLMNGNVPIEESVRAIAAGAPSRGEIIPAALAQGGLRAVEEWIRRDFDPTLYPAFMLLIAHPDAARLYSWWAKGSLEAQELESPWALVSSSQWQTAQVLAYRDAAFRAWLKEGPTFSDGLPDIHRYRAANEEAFGIWVERGYACTRSITQVAVTEDTAPIVMRYAPVDGEIGTFSSSTLPRII